MAETSELTCPLIKALNQTGGYAIRMNSGKICMGKRWIQLHEAGTADILFFERTGDRFLAPPTPHIWHIDPGTPTWIETKQPKGKTAKEQIDAQAAFKARVENLGHKYIMVRSIAECFDALGL